MLCCSLLFPSVFVWRAAQKKIPLSHFSSFQWEDVSPAAAAGVPPEQERREEEEVEKGSGLGFLDHFAFEVLMSLMSS